MERFFLTAVDIGFNRPVSTGWIFKNSNSTYMKQRQQEVIQIITALMMMAGVACC